MPGARHGRNLFMVTFKSARLKIKRADEHIADVDRQISDLRSPERQRITREINPQTGDQFLHYDFESPLPLDDLALVIGDTIHNLKTAIDYAWHILLSAFAPALANSKKSSFPVDVSRHQLEHRLRGVKIHTPCPDLFLFVLDTLRPYSEGGNSVLYAIHDLDIRDKHKLLVPLARVTAVVDAVLENEAGHTIQGVSFSTMNEALPITVPIGAKTKVKDYGHLAFEVTLDQRSAVHTLSITETLRTFSKVTLSAVEAMEDFFARTS